LDVVLDKAASRKLAKGSSSPVQSLSVGSSLTLFRLVLLADRFSRLGQSHVLRLFLEEFFPRCPCGSDLR